MRILQVIPTLNRGGAEKIVVTLANGMAENNDVFLCTLFDEINWNETNFKNELKNVKLKTFHKRLGFDLKIMFRLLFFIKKNKPDVVHSHMSSINYLILSYLFLFFTKTKFFHTIHNDADKELNNKLDLNIKKILYKIKLVNPICISNTSNKSFYETFKMSGTLIENCIEKPILTDSNLDAESFIENLHKKHQYVFVNIGRISKQKNQLELAKAIISLNSKGHNIGLVIVGGKRPGEEESFTNLNELISDSVYLIGEKNNATDYLFYADAFILPSIHEGMPITLLEALSIGCVPICTHVGGIIDVIVDGVNGHVILGENYLDIEIGILKFLNNDEIDISKNCMNTYNNRYNLDAYINAHLQIFKQ